jgi:hypothetical protein
MEYFSSSTQALTPPETAESEIAAVGITASISTKTISGATVPDVG